MDATSKPWSSIVNATLPLHPYYPLGLPIPTYVANDKSTIEIMTYFATGCASVLTATLIVARRMGPNLPRMELATIVWFVLSGIIHLGMEGYVVYHSAGIAAKGTVLGQAWKEYSLSDSRYLTQDSFVIMMEAITAIFWGPLCLAIAFCIVVDHPLRHPLQTIVSLGQIYGDVLYYGTCAYEHTVRGVVYTRPEAYYFWFYFIFMNSIWIVVPSMLLTSSVRETTAAFSTMRALQARKKTR